MGGGRPFGRPSFVLVQCVTGALSGMTFSLGGTLRGLVLLLSLDACARGEVVSSDVVRTDSAGVRIITSGAMDRALTWRFEEIAPLVDTLGSPWVFSSLGNHSVVTDRAGRTYVLTDDPAILRFGRSGRLERSIGRRGGAPGEMRTPTALLVQGDSIAVLDRQRNVLVRWGPTLDPIADLPLTGAFENADAIEFRSGGVWIFRRKFDPAGSTITLEGDTLTPSPLLSLTQPRPTILRGCTSVAVGLPPFFSPEFHWSTYRGQLLANVGPAYDLRLYEGPRLIASVRRPLTPRAGELDDVRRAHPDGYRLQAGPVDCTFPLEQLVEGPGVAPFFPLVHGVVLLSDGTIWVKRSAGELTPSVLDVFTSDGAYAGTVTGMRLPLALLPNGELLVPRDDAGSGGVQIVRTRVVR